MSRSDTTTENSAENSAFPPPLAGEGQGGGKPSGTVRDNTPAPDLESELRSPRTPQGGGGKNAAKHADTQQGFSEAEVNSEDLQAMTVSMTFRPLRQETKF